MARRSRWQHFSVCSRPEHAVRSLRAVLYATCRHQNTVQPVMESEPPAFNRDELARDRELSRKQHDASVEQQSSQSGDLLPAGFMRTEWCDVHAVLIDEQYGRTPPIQSGTAGGRSEDGIHR